MGISIIGAWVTQWYQGDVAPYRTGWYECQFGSFGKTVMRWWHGRWFQSNLCDLDSTFGTYPGDRWRGLKFQWPISIESIE